MTEMSKEQVAEIVSAVLSAMKQDTTKTGDKKQSQKGKTPPVEVPTKTSDDIPKILGEMSKTESIKRFGFCAKSDTPYHILGVSKFLEDFNIKPKNKWEEKQGIRFSYADKHQVISTQLQGENKKVFNKTKNTCMKILETKLTTIPDTTRFGKPMSEKQRDNIESALKLEIGRWQREQFRA